MNKTSAGTLLILLSAVCFGLMPIFTVLSYREGVGVITLLFLRFSLAAVFLLVYMPLRQIAFTVTRRQLASLFMLGGVIYALQAWSYFSAVKYIPASLAVLAFYTYPILVAVSASLFDKSPLSGRYFMAIGLSIAGLVFVVGASPSAINPFGIALALTAAACYACYLLAGNKLVRQMPAITTIAYVALFASITFGLAGFTSGEISFAMTSYAWLYVLVLVAASTLALLLLFRGLELVDPTKASILSMIEPLVTAIFSAAVFGETLSPLQIAGSAVVLAGAGLVITAKEVIPEAKKETDPA